MSADACADYERLLLRLAEKAPDLDPVDRARVEAHLANCASCREALEAQIFVRSALAGREPMQASVGFAARTLARIEESQRHNWLTSVDFKRWTWRLVPVAAALALIVAYGAGQVNTQSSAAATSSSSSGPDGRTVSAALWSDDVTEVDVLALMLRASADDDLAASLKGSAQ